MSEEMASTNSSAGCLARFIAARTAATRLVTPVDVSFWTMHTALILCSRSSLSFVSTTWGSAPWRQSVDTETTSKPSLTATSCHSTEN